MVVKAARSAAKETTSSADLERRQWRVDLVVRQQVAVPKRRDLVVVVVVLPPRRENGYGHAVVLSAGVFNTLFGGLSRSDTAALTVVAI